MSVSLRDLATWTCSRPRRSTSCARSPPSSSARCCCSPAARTRSSCCTWRRRRSGRRKVPFPVMHVDTGHNFHEVIDFRDRRVAELGVQPRRRLGAGVDRHRPRREIPGGVAQPAADRHAARRDRGATASTPSSAAPAATRRRRAPRSASSPSATSSASGTRRTSGPSSGTSTTAGTARGEHIRVFPLSNWTELDIWAYIARERIEIPSIYYAHEREVFERDGMLLAVTAYIAPLPTRAVHARPCATAPSATRPAPAPSSPTRRPSTRSSPRSPPRAITERGATRADDRASEAAMEDRKREGYF